MVWNVVLHCLYLQGESDVDIHGSCYSSKAKIRSSVTVKDKVYILINMLQEIIFLILKSQINPSKQYTPLSKSYYDVFLFFLQQRLNKEKKSIVQTENIFFYIVNSFDANNVFIE